MADKKGNLKLFLHEQLAHEAVSQIFPNLADALYPDAIHMVQTAEFKRRFEIDEPDLADFDQMPKGDLWT